MARPLPVDPQIWRAIAGPCSQFPTVNSRVYYFPQGNIEQASSPPQNLSNFIPCTLCTVLSVQFLANPITDEVFAKLLLQPLPRDPTADPTPFTNLFLQPDPPNPAVPNPSTTAAVGGYGADYDVVSFAKDLSASEVFPFSAPIYAGPAPIQPPTRAPFLPPPAPAGVSFLSPPAPAGVSVLSPPARVPFRRGPEASAICFVPDFLAKHIFPPINLRAEWQQQVITVTDVNGKNWQFQHCYDRNGGAVKHTLLTGWGEFATGKMLLAGDFVVFMKKHSLPGRIFIGIRRDAAKGKVQPHLVENAVRSAAENLPFEVYYYPSPRTGWSECVVKAEVVEDAMRKTLNKLQSGNGIVGLKVMMDLEAGQSSQVNRFLGKISSVNVTQSPWRMLEIEWDEKEMTMLQNFKWVSPWEVKLVTSPRRK